MQYVLYITDFGWCIVYHILCHALYVVYIVHSTLRYMDRIVCRVYCVLRIAYCVVCRIYGGLHNRVCTVYCVLCIAYSIFVIVHRVFRSVYDTIRIAHCL